jgi:hypothetical protein
VLYGEWLYAKHTIFYDRLPQYFLEFDVLDLESDAFLSTARRRELLGGCRSHRFTFFGKERSPLVPCAALIH